jgi:hypothetical protein
VLAALALAIIVSSLAAFADSNEPVSLAQTSPTTVPATQVHSEKSSDEGIVALTVGLGLLGLALFSTALVAYARQLRRRDDVPPPPTTRH